MRTALTTTPRAPSTPRHRPLPATGSHRRDSDPVIAPARLGERIGRTAGQALFALACIAVVVLFPVLECARMALDAVVRSDD